MSKGTVIISASSSLYCGKPNSSLGKKSTSRLGGQEGGVNKKGSWEGMGLVTEGRGLTQPSTQRLKGIKWSH